MWLELKELRLCEKLSGCFEESLLIGSLVEFTDLMIQSIETSLPRLQNVVVSRHLHQGSTTQGAVKTKVHHLQQTKPHTMVHTQTCVQWLLL